MTRFVWYTGLHVLELYLACPLPAPHSRKILLPPSQPGSFETDPPGWLVSRSTLPAPNNDYGRLFRFIW